MERFLKKYPLAVGPETSHENVSSWRFTVHDFFLVPFRRVDRYGICKQYTKVMFSYTSISIASIQDGTVISMGYRIFRAKNIRLCEVQLGSF
jgi:hypothetical protein